MAARFKTCVPLLACAVAAATGVAQSTEPGPVPVPLDPAEYWEGVAENFAELSEYAREDGNERLGERYERGREAAQDLADRYEPAEPPIGEVIAWPR